MRPGASWNIPPPRKTFVVGVADMVAANDAGADLVTHSLGSCLGITVYDPVRKIGGLLHVMLPDSGIDANKAASAPCMFVDTGVPRLFRAVCSLGAEPRQLEVKVAGGAQLLDPQGLFNIGERNQQAFSLLMARNGYMIRAREVGGTISRTLRIDLGTGEVTTKSPGLELRRL